MADVQVTFGAKIDDLVRGINEVKSQLDQLKGKLDEIGTHTQSVANGIQHHTSALKEFAAALLAAFSVDAVATFVEKMADLGSRMETISHTMGISSESVVQLASIAKLTGTSIDSLTGGIERMSLNIQRATHNSTNPFAQALKNLGLSTKDFIGLQGDQYFLKLADAVSKFNPSINLTTNLVQLGGRSFASMIPALLQGREAFEKYGESIRQATQGLAQAQPGMSDTHSKLVMLSLSVDGLRARIFTVLKPAIDYVINAMIKWTQSLDSATIVSAVNTTVDYLQRFLLSIGNFVTGIGTLVDAVITKIKELGGWLKEADDFAKNLASGFNLGSKLRAALGGGEEPAKQFEDRWKSATDNSLRQMGAWESGVLKAMKVIRDSANTLNLPPTGAPTGGGKTAPALQFPQSGGSALSEAQRQIGIIDQQYQMEVEKINHAFKMSSNVFGEAEAQKTQALLAAINTRMSAELAALEQAQAAYGRGSKEYQKIEDEKTKIIQKAALDRLRIENQAAEQSWEKWKSASDSMASSFSSNYRAMLTGQMTFTQAVGRMTGDMILKWMGDLTKMAFEWVAKQLFMATATKAVQASDVAGHAAAETAKTAATTAGVGARTGAEAAGASANIFTKIGEALSYIFMQAGKVFAGVFANLAPFLGPAAAGPAAASQAEVIAVGAGSIGAFDQGTDYVHRSGLAIIHQGEQIVPARATAGYTGANGGGSANVNTTVNVNLSAVDGVGMQRWLNSGGGAMIAAYVSKTQNRNPSLRGAY